MFFQQTKIIWSSWLTVFTVLKGPYNKCRYTAFYCGFFSLLEMILMILPTLFLCKWTSVTEGRSYKKNNSDRQLKNYFSGFYQWTVKDSHHMVLLYHRARAGDVLLDVVILPSYNKTTDKQGVDKVLLIWKHVTYMEICLTFGWQNTLENRADLSHFRVDRVWWRHVGQVVCVGGVFVCMCWWVSFLASDTRTQ